MAFFGNPLQSGASDTWLMDVADPVADIVDVTPDPRNTSVGEVTLSFSEPVTGFDIDDLSLTRDGAPHTHGRVRGPGDERFVVRREGKRQDPARTVLCWYFENAEGLTDDQRQAMTEGMLAVLRGDEVDEDIFSQTQPNS